MTHSRSVPLPKAVTDAVWSNVQEQSAVMSLSNQMALPGNGVSVPMITGDAVANFVNEGAKKPVSDASVAYKVMTPYKIAVIQAFTDEFRRDEEALYNELANRLPGALADRFDSAVFHGPTPGSGFDTLAAVGTNTIDGTDTYGDLVAVDSAIAVAGGELNGWVLAPKGRGVLLGAKDLDGRPLLINDIQREGGVNSIFGAQVVRSKAAFKADGAGDAGETLGFAGDWTSAYYGVVSGIEVSSSDQSTLTISGSPVNLWEQNMFALRAEVTVGFAVKDAARFRRLTGDNSVF